MTKAEMFKEAHAAVKAQIAEVRRTRGSRTADALIYAKLFAGHYSVIYWKNRNAVAMAAFSAERSIVRELNAGSRYY